MKKLNGGYARYFNERNKRKGALFEGRFKAKHIGSDDYLLHLSAYVNLNDRVHKLSHPTSKSIIRSSRGEYLGSEVGFCKKDIVLNQFKNTEEYKMFADESLADILLRRYPLGDGVGDVEELSHPTSK